MISLLFAVLFGLSLLPGRKPLCLKFAERVSGGIVPDGAEGYCRILTAVWAAVLLGNAALGALIATSGPGVWGLPASLLASAAIVAGTFVVERRVRGKRFSIAFRTSGSTAAPKAIVKTFESLAKEVAFHRARLTDVLAQNPLFLSTVEPQHMYGMLWRVMLPRAADCPVDPEIILSPESLLAKMQAAEKVFLVTTPSFLERFSAYADLYRVPRNAIEIITSGALLPPAVSAATARIFGRVPLEIFGSTETGGVACRRQTVPDCDWTLFDPVRAHASADGRLMVSSPFSFRRTFTMGDGVTFTGKRTFKLHGRLDRLVKIAEQRVLLPELEAAMCRLPDVAEAALCPLDGPHGTFLGAVVVPQGALAVIRADGGPKRALALRRQLLPLFPKGTAPRKYRFVHELPRNMQGKIQTEALRAILASNMVEPVVANVARTEDTWTADLTFDPEAPYFKGHFPGLPLLPGVVQLGFAHHFAESFLGRPFLLGSVRKMKFTRPVRPGETVRLALTKRGEDEIAYTYAAGDAVCSSGVLYRARTASSRETHSAPFGGGSGFRVTPGP